MLRGRGHAPRLSRIMSPARYSPSPRTIRGQRLLYQNCERIGKIGDGGVAQMVRAADS